MSGRELAGRAGGGEGDAAGVSEQEVGVGDDGVGGVECVHWGMGDVGLRGEEVEERVFGGEGIRSVGDGGRGRWEGGLEDIGRPVICADDIGLGRGEDPGWRRESISSSDVKRALDALETGSIERLELGDGDNFPAMLLEDALRIF